MKGLKYQSNLLHSINKTDLNEQQVGFVLGVLSAQYSTRFAYHVFFFWGGGGGEDPQIKKIKSS